MRVIGTAGHVDHGKSTLVKALTGIHPDRLKEEREREMTIDLGFAWMSLPARDIGESEEIGIIDVPGHRDFIENMLAGVGGIDAALFVVAADEGVMPQTREHLAILNLLQIQGGVIAITKIDMVENDADWLDLVESDLRQVTQGTVLGSAAIVRVSAISGEGIPELKEALRASLAERPPRPDLNRPRLPVDRVFTIAGFGSVVTGTLADGKLSVGDEVEVLPQGLRGRVRGLQTHKRKEQVAVAGSRTAVNISGIAIEDIHRGDIIAHPGDFKPTRRMDVHFRLLPDVSQPLKHNTEVKLFLAASEVVARLRLLGIEQINPGEEGWLQLELSHPVVAVRGDRYILRRPSPGETLGGGEVVDPQPKGRHKRFSTQTLAGLESLSLGSGSEVLLQALQALGVATLKDVFTRSNLDVETAFSEMIELVASGEVLILEDKPASTTRTQLSPDQLVIARTAWEQFAARLLREVENYHSNFPLRSGMPREELKSRSKAYITSPRVFNAAITRLIASGDLQENGPLVLCSGHTIRFNPDQQRKIEQLMKRFALSSLSPPTIKECQAEVGDDLVNALIETGELVAVSSEVVFDWHTYQRMLADVHRLIENKSTLSVAEARDYFNTSRRYVLAFLEHLDAIGVTVRDGDVRKLKQAGNQGNGNQVVRN